MIRRDLHGPAEAEGGAPILPGGKRFLADFHVADTFAKRVLGRLDAPQRIQLFVNAIPANHEIGGETILSVREVLRQRRAHCIEGAFVAACALWIHGESPLLMFMDCDESDHPHVLALFQLPHLGP